MTEYRSVVVADHHKAVFVCQILSPETGEVVGTTVPVTREVLCELLTHPWQSLPFCSSRRAGPGSGSAT